MSDRISEAEMAAALDQLRRVDYDYPATENALLFMGRLVAEVRRLRALVVAQADLGCCSMHERCEGGWGAELVEAEAKAIRAESAPKGPGTEAGTRAKPGS